MKKYLPLVLVIAGAALLLPTFLQEKGINFGVKAGPTFFLVNKEGKIVYSREGFIRDELLEEIDKYLN